MDKLTYKEIAAAVAGVAAVRWVDFDLGQLEQESPPVSFPCVVIGFDSANYLDLSGVAQQGTMVLGVRVAFKLFERTHSKTSPSFQDEALGHLDTLQNVHAALQGLAGTNFGALSRTGFATEKRMDLRVYRMTYTTLVEDEGTGSDGTGGNAINYVPWADIPMDSPDLCLDGEVAGYEATDQPEKLLPIP